MHFQLLEQLYSFAVFILVGFLIGLLFDFFRISRRTFKTSDLITSIEDVLFWILSGLLILFTIFKFNNGDIRIYIILSILIGIVIYILIFSKIVMNTLVKIIIFIKRIISHLLKICSYPIQFILKLLKNLFKPVKILQKAISNKIKKIIKIKKNKNKSYFKKDFA